MQTGSRLREAVRMEVWLLVLFLLAMGVAWLYLNRWKSKNKVKTDNTVNNGNISNTSKKSNTTRCQIPLRSTPACLVSPTYTTRNREMLSSNRASPGTVQYSDHCHDFDH